MDVPITDFSAISFQKQTKFFPISIVDTYFQVYFSLFLYQLTSYSAHRVSMVISQGERNYVSESEHRLYAR